MTMPDLEDVLPATSSFALSIRISSGRKTRYLQVSRLAIFTTGTFWVVPIGVRVQQLLAVDMMYGVYVQIFAITAIIQWDKKN
jgi:hypothetical protein